MSKIEQLNRLKLRGCRCHLSKDDLNQLVKWIDHRNKHGKLVSINLVKSKVKRMTNGRWIPSPSWVSKTLKKLKFSSHLAKSKKPQQLSRKFRKEINNFREKIKDYFEKNCKNENFNMWVMDEKGIWNHSPTLRTYTRRKNPIPYVCGLKRNNSKDTMVGTVSNRGKKLPIFWIQSKRSKFSVRTLLNGEKERKLVEKGVSGMNLIQMNKWVDYFIPYTHPNDVLIMDNLRVHHNKQIKEKI